MPATFPIRKPKQRGSAILEFVLAGIVCASLMITTVQVALAMWCYHTMAYAVHETNRYIVTHGRNCALGGNSCTITVGNIYTKFTSNGIGLPPGSVNLTLTSNSGTVKSCSPMNTCSGDSTQWPPVAHMDNGVGNLSTLTATYPYKSAIVMLWYGFTGRQNRAITLSSTSRQQMLF